MSEDTEHYALCESCGVPLWPCDCSIDADHYGDVECDECDDCIDDDDLDDVEG